MSEKVVLSVDIGGSKLMVGLVDRKGNILVKEKEALYKGISEKQIVEKIYYISQRLINVHTDVLVDTVGIAIPGLADSKAGMWLYSCFSGISDFPIALELSALLKLPVFIGNDVNVCAYGEKMRPVRLGVP